MAVEYALIDFFLIFGDKMRYTFRWFTETFLGCF